MEIHRDANLVEEINRLFHDLTATSYEKVHPEIFRVQRCRMKRFLREYLDGHFPIILDAGSGDGFMLSVIKEAGSPTFERFLMLDISFGMLRTARRKHPDALLINASSTRIPLKDGSVDLITANSVLHHLPDPEQFLKEARRVLKKGGMLLVNHEPNLRFSRNGLLWNISIMASRVKRNARPIKVLRRLVASLRGIGNPVYREINRILMEEGLIDEPLPDRVISAYIDYHSPTAGMLRRGVGIDPSIFEKYFRIVHMETYAHLGKVGERHGGGVVGFIQSILERRYPMDGSKLTALMIKE